MAKRGKTPSLVGGGAGASKFVEAKKKRTCSRGECQIKMGEKCIEVNVPGTMGKKTYCCDCFEEILEQSQGDLDKLKNELEQVKKG